MAASGGSVSVGVFRPAVAFFSGAVCELFTAVVLPASVVVIVLAFIGNLSPEVPTEKLGDFFKSISKWLIGLTLGLFTLFLTVQGIASSQYDGLSLRAVKYLVSGLFPLSADFYRAEWIWCLRAARSSKTQSVRLPFSYSLARSCGPSCSLRHSSFFCALQRP